LNALAEPVIADGMRVYHLRDTDVIVKFGLAIRKRVRDEIAALGCSRALILSTPAQSESALTLAAEVGNLAAGVFSKAAMHTPVNISEEAAEHARSIKADCLISIGGGSTIGLGKAIAYRTDLPQIVVPTTYAGSEATAILGQTQGGVKTTLIDRKVLPEVILYDPQLVTSLSTTMSANSALNAMAHAAEALYGQSRSEETTAMAIDGLESIIENLPSVIANPSDLTARENTLYGAWCCGTVLGRVDMALHHKLCHTLGGSFDLPHAETHAVVLPHAIDFNERAVADQLAPITKLLNGSSAGGALYNFARQVGAPSSLAELGLKESDLEKATDLAVSKPYWNPQPVTREAIRKILHAAWAGEPPVFAVVAAQNKHAACKK